MDFLFTINSSYVEQIKVLIKSICVNNVGIHKFWFIHNDLTEASQNSIKDYVKMLSKNHSAEFIAFDRPEMLKLPLHGLTWSIEIYFRLFAPYLLPIDKVLYLDGDVIVNGDLTDFYSKDMEGQTFYRCVANDIIDSHNARLNLPKDNTYINSGVLLLDLKKMREIPVEDTIRLLWENKERFKFPDQDYINCIYQDQKELVDNRYNYMISVAEINSSYQRQNDIRICHYVMEKPWNIKFPYKTDGLYFKYLALAGKWYKIPKLLILHRMYRLYQLIFVPKQHRRI